MSNNDTGLAVFNAKSTLSVAHSVITSNVSLGYQIANGGAINSFGDNDITLNGGNTGALTPVAPQ